MTVFGRIGTSFIFIAVLLLGAVACARPGKTITPFTPKALTGNVSAPLLLAAQYEGVVGPTENVTIAAELAEAIVAQINAAPEVIVVPENVYTWQLITASPWFNSNYMEDERVPENSAVVYVRRPSAAGAGVSEILVDSGRGATLVGYAISPRELLATAPVQVSLFWRLEAEIVPFVTILRLQSTVDGAAVAQVSADIPRSLPADFWQPGELIEERFTLDTPPDAATGSYELNVALHPITSTAFLPLTRDGDANLLDKVVLAHLSAPWVGEIGVGAQELGTQMGEGVVLDSAEITHQPDDNLLQTTLYWQADQSPTRDYVVFVHLFDAAGNFIANHDGPPRNGSYITRSWQPGQIVEDMHPIVLPDDLAAGRYVVKVGMYDWETQVRLGVVEGSGGNSAESSITIGEINLP